MFLAVLNICLPGSRLSAIETESASTSRDEHSPSLGSLSGSKAAYIRTAEIHKIRQWRNRRISVRVDPIVKDLALYFLSSFLAHKFLLNFGKILETISDFPALWYTS